MNAFPGSSPKPLALLDYEGNPPEDFSPSNRIICGDGRNFPFRTLSEVGPDKIVDPGGAEPSRCKQAPTAIPPPEVKAE